MLNRIVLMGRLTRDPELRHTQTGTPVASFTLAVDRDFKDKNTGERATDWIDVVAWRATGEFVSRYFTKGRLAYPINDLDEGYYVLMTFSSDPAFPAELDRLMRINVSVMRSIIVSKEA